MGRKKFDMKDKEAQARMRIAKKIAALGNALKDDWFKLSDKVITLNTGKQVRVPHDLGVVLDQYLEGVGSCTTIAMQLRRFAKCMSDRIYNHIEEFENPDDDLMRLVIDDGQPSRGPI